MITIARLASHHPVDVADIIDTDLSPGTSLTASTRRLVMYSRLVLTVRTKCGSLTLLGALKRGYVHVGLRLLSKAEVFSLALSLRVPTHVPPHTLIRENSTASLNLVVHHDYLSRFKSVGGGNLSPSSARLAPRSTPIATNCLKSWRERMPRRPCEQ